MVKYPVITKTCSSCGQEKPMSAFLQIGSTQGSIYGNICSSCRKTNATQQKTPKDSDDRTTSKTDHSIDSKVKVAGEIEKNERAKEVEERYHKDRDLTEEKLTKTNEKVLDTEKKEKNHREQYITKKVEKRSIFDNQLPRSKEAPTPEQVFGGEAQLTKEREINLSEAADTRAKYTQSPNYARLKAWLGPDANLISHAERAKIMADRKRAEKKTGSEKEVTEKEATPAENIRRTWKPGK